MAATKHQRLEEFLRRLGAAAPAGSEEEALGLLGRILIEVEDELSGIPFDPTYPLNDGRMYPPKADNRRSGENGVARYRSRAHNTLISNHGSIRIEEVGGKCLIEKAGRSGKRSGKRI